MTGTINPPPPEVTDEGIRGWTPYRVLALLLVLAFVAFWVWAFSPWAPSRKADGLVDTTYATRANAQCRAAKAQLDALPRAHSAATPAARADIVDSSNITVASMIEELRADTASMVGRDRELLDQWLADWDAYLQSRRDYATELRTEPDVQFTVPARHGGQITETMDGFSRTNEIFDCLVPLDV
jgi:hypothetical protein